MSGFDGSPVAINAIKDGALPYTVLQPAAVFVKKAGDEADGYLYLRTGKTGASTEKPFFPCIVITKAKVNDVVAPLYSKTFGRDTHLELPA